MENRKEETSIQKKEMTRKEGYRGEMEGVKEGYRGEMEGLKEGRMKEGKRGRGRKSKKKRRGGAKIKGRKLPLKKEGLVVYNIYIIYIQYIIHQL